ncbi:DUF4344 domain-containing metallopeptidase [Litoreibacter janthinus]|uniref:Putative metallopeptidase n=1 Tax=Litoreibacter janthinus TaxID=670154 RepID=A0A1I6G8K8_9RHOB|nr:DUF4344 domain-containing metallopeptidase [Litoreibacter janthinus]SFR38532.1 Putative metallopeptidase [Litoreibacter janthinus]
MKRLIAAAVCLPLSALAEEPVVEEQTAFVEANLLAIFYHEMAHAVIDLMEIPIYGQEEDAADTMAVLLIDALYEEEVAQGIAYDSAFGYINDPDGTEEVAYWDLHGPDEQRYFNHVCLFYGAAPEDREELAEDLGLPPERAVSCSEEYEQAIDSWGQIFDELEDGKGGSSFTLRPAAENEPARIRPLIEQEVAALNRDFALPTPVEVRIEACDEANAFYDPESVSITLCTEFEPYLDELFQKLDLD